jgi:hypothetical protein
MASRRHTVSTRWEKTGPPGIVVSTLLSLWRRVAVDDIAKHADSVGALLHVIGPRARARVVLVLRALGLSAEEAEKVIAYGIAQGKFAVDPADPNQLQAVRR